MKRLILFISLISLPVFGQVNSNTVTTLGDPVGQLWNLYSRNTNGTGAARIGVIDSSGVFTGTTVEAVMGELYNTATTGIDTNALRIDGSNAMTANLSLGGNDMIANSGAQILFDGESIASGGGNLFLQARGFDFTVTNANNVQFNMDGDTFQIDGGIGINLFDPVNGGAQVFTNLGTVHATAFHGDGANLSGLPLIGSTNIFMDGLYNLKQSTFVTNSGTNVTMEVELIGGGDIFVYFDGVAHVLDCTPKASVTLIPGTDTAPVKNYVYLTDGGTVATLTASTAFPSSKYAMMADVTLGSAATTISDGTPLSMRRWSDSFRVDDRSAVANNAERLRIVGADLLNGVTPSVNNVGDSVTFSTLSGTIYQKHRQAFPVFAAGSEIVVVNHYTAPYTVITNLAQITSDANTNAISNNEWFGVTIGGLSASGNDGENRLVAFLSSDSYATAQQAQAESDENGYDQSVPPEWMKGLVFPIARVVMKRNGATGFDEAILQDIRFPSLFATGGGGSGATSHDPVTLAGTPDYITISGQVITRNAVDLTADITGNLPVANLNSGTGAGAGTFWRGDGTWGSPEGTAGALGTHVTNNFVRIVDPVMTNEWTMRGANGVSIFYARGSGYDIAVDNAVTWTFSNKTDYAGELVSVDALATLGQDANEWPDAFVDKMEINDVEITAASTTNLSVGAVEVLTVNDTIAAAKIGNGLTDAQVSDTLTIGSGGSVDAGALPSAVAYKTNVLEDVNQYGGIMGSMDDGLFLTTTNRSSSDVTISGTTWQQVTDGIPFAGGAYFGRTIYYVYTAYSKEFNGTTDSPQLELNVYIQFNGSTNWTPIANATHKTVKDKDESDNVLYQIYTSWSTTFSNTVIALFARDTGAGTVDLNGNFEWLMRVDKRTLEGP